MRIFEASPRLKKLGPQSDEPRGNEGASSGSCTPVVFLPGNVGLQGSWAMLGQGFEDMRLVKGSRVKRGGLAMERQSPFLCTHTALFTPYPSPLSTCPVPKERALEGPVGQETQG